MSRYSVYDDVLDKIQTNDQDEGYLSGAFELNSSGKYDRIVISDISETPLGNQTVGKWTRAENQQDVKGENQYPFLLYIPVDGNTPQLFDCSNGKVLKPLTIIEFKSEFLSRVAPLIGNVESLGNKKTSIIGLGSVGSIMALFLAQSGTRDFELIDPENVDAANLCRSIYQRNDVGRPKVDALKDRLVAGINPGVRVNTLQEDITSIPEDILDQMIQSSDLVIAATDSIEGQRLINSRAYRHTPVIYVGLYPGANTGEIIFTLPDTTACYECILGDLLRQPQVPERGRPDYDRANRLMSEPGLGPDIAHVTAAAAKIALAVLTRDLISTELVEIIRPSHSLLLMANKPEWIFPESFQSVWVQTTRNNDCQACQTESEVVL